MHLNGLLGRDSPCPELDSCPPVSCPGQCNTKTQTCTLIAPACPRTCATIRCDPIPVSSGSSGPGPGTLGGAIAGSLVLLGLVILGYFYYRRREAAKAAVVLDNAPVDVKPDIPARADAVLSRPDPHFSTRASALDDEEKSRTTNHLRPGEGTELGAIRMQNGQPATTANAYPTQPTRAPSTHSNPFVDGASIQTASVRTQSPNVIPIALVPPSSYPPEAQNHARADTSPRSGRSPDLSLRNNPLDLEHVAMSDSDLGEIRLPYAGSTRSDVSGYSYKTTSSSPTDLDESPMIISPTQGVVRQVFGVSQAQVVRVPSSTPTASSDGMPDPLNVATRALRPNPTPKAGVSKGIIGRSPLAQQSFTPGDVMLREHEPTSPASMTTARGDPFSDAASPSTRASYADSSRTTDTFGSRPTEFHSQGPFTPRPGTTFADVQDSRPVSNASTLDGASIRADIGTASRVMINTRNPSAYSGSLSRATSMQTSGGRTVASTGRDDDDHSGRRHSLISSKTTSSRADSVLAGFPFVPPSPISSLPPRSPGSPGSPGAAGSMFARQQQLNSSSAARSPPVPPSPSASPGSATASIATRSTATQRPSPAQRAPLPPIPKIIAPASGSRDEERREHPLSATSSSGLEKYPFQFGSPAVTQEDTTRASRASLDTLALSRDLAAFPIGYDRMSGGPSQRSMK